MSFYKWLGIAFGVYPRWAYNLECKKCKMCFLNAKQHFEYVMNKLEKEHGGK